MNNDQLKRVNELQQQIDDMGGCPGGEANQWIIDEYMDIKNEITSIIASQRRKSQPDCPSALEAAAEYFQIAMKIAETGESGSPPWGDEISPSQAINEAMESAKMLLVAKLSGIK